MPVYVSGSLALASISAKQGGEDITLPRVNGTNGHTAETIKAFVAKDIDAAMDSLQITLKDTTTAIDKMWLVERYVLTESNSLR